MAGPFDRNIAERRRWWDERLWLQMIIVGLIIVFALSVVYGLSTVVLVVAAASTLGVYALTRLLLR